MKISQYGGNAVKHGRDFTQSPKIFFKELDACRGGCRDDVCEGRDDDDAIDDISIDDVLGNEVEDGFDGEKDDYVHEVDGDVDEEDVCSYYGDTSSPRRCL